MEPDKLLKELEKIKDVKEKIRFLEKIIATEKDVKAKTALKELVERLKKSDKKEEPKKPARLEDMVVRSGIIGPEATVRLTDAEYARQFGRPPRTPSLAAMTELPKDRLKEDYVQNKNYIEKTGQQQQPGEYTRNETPEYIARQRVEQSLAFRPVEEQQQRPTGADVNRPPRTDEEYKRQEAIQGAIRDKELNREDYLREKRKKDLMMMR